MRVTDYERRCIEGACRRGERRLGIKYVVPALGDRCALIAETVLEREPIPWTWAEVAHYLIAHGRQALEEYIRQQFVALWAIAHGVPWWIPCQAQHKTMMQRIGDAAFLLNGSLIEAERWQVIAIGWACQRLDYNQEDVIRAFTKVTAPTQRRVIAL